jgi:Tfp pilus assembly protein PilF
LEKASENYQKALELDPEHAATDKEMAKLNKLINEME